MINLKLKVIYIFFVIFMILGLNTAYSFNMDTVKGWGNKVIPNLFDLPDATSDTSKKERESFSNSRILVLKNLKAREEELKRKEEAYIKKTKELKILSQQIEQKLDQMRELANDMERQRQSRKNLDEKDITKMVKLYETMGAENTAAFINKLDRQTATHILMRMNPRKASAVMQLLDTKVAVDITEIVTRFTENRVDSAQK